MKTYIAALRVREKYLGSVAGYQARSSCGRRPRGIWLRTAGSGDILALIGEAYAVQEAIDGE